jgi:hypothetical protein
MSCVQLMSFESGGKVRLAKVVGAASLQPEDAWRSVWRDECFEDQRDASALCIDSIFVLA